ncbi:MAG: hypothetical protein JRF65_11015, partial [Deltaproteobacteria bacterium]|nr:hypothetical protein [Deltaproteobacteria bacterium]
SLNVVLDSRWGRLKPEWNSFTRLRLFPTWRATPYDRNEFVKALSAPKIIHFETSLKPWHDERDPSDEYVVRFFHYFRRIDWLGQESLRMPGRRKIGGFFVRSNRRAVHLFAAAWHAIAANRPATPFVLPVLKNFIQYPWTIFELILVFARDLRERHWIQKN